MKWQSDPDAIDWQGVKRDILLKLTCIEAAWRETYTNSPPELHAAMVRDLYGPVLDALFDFVIAVEISDVDAHRSGHEFDCRSPDSE